MTSYTNILQKYWGYLSFRELQQEIIQSVADGKDTLGLMPTGGGKSITYQVYSLSTEGICLVVTPLIALMKDQVEGLRKRGIKALSIFSGMSKMEQKVALDNATWGDYKFLYISPERIASDHFRERVQRMNVNLIAIDEAHCISQWGYDFRPSYLRIVELREIFPEIRIMALTATATPRVVNDIQDKLQFKEHNVLQKSFTRENLTYKVRIEENKIGYLVRTLQQAKGSGVIYTRNRKKTKEIVDELIRNKISANYYHAGLNPEIRNKRQDDWISGKTRIIVATNAFGMGIDKSNVRFVLHFDAPDSIEAYFQEAGRAGRDEKRAMAVLLYNKADTVRLKKGIADKFPPSDLIKRVYEALGNYLKIPIGFGKSLSYNFNIIDFARHFKFSTIQAYNALKILELDGYIELTDAFDRPSMVYFSVNRDDLYKFQISNKHFDSFIKLVLRSYTGMFTEYRPVNEELLAKRANTTRDIVYKYFTTLSALNIIDYIPQRDKPFIVFDKERIDVKRLIISNETYGTRKKLYEKQVLSVIEYATSTSKCRNQQLLSYFGETTSARCGNCDVCKSLNDLGISNLEFERIRNDIKIVLTKTPRLKHELFFELKGEEEKIQHVIRWLLDNEKIIIRIDEKLEWKED